VLEKDVIDDAAEQGGLDDDRQGRREAERHTRAEVEARGGRDLEQAPIDGPALTPADTEKLMQSITPDSQVSNVKLNGGADFGFAFGEKARFRVSVMKAKTNYGMVLRQIPYKMFGLRDIGMPDKIRELPRSGASASVPDPDHEDVAAS